jgi:hypothetical protein
MKMIPPGARPFGVIRVPISLLCVLLLAANSQIVYAQEPAPAEAPAPKIPNDQLDSLVAPIALYPDPLLAQMLAASTYPLEIIQLQQWLQANPTLKDKALVDAVEKQNWDPSVQAMAPLPDALKQLSQNITWTTDLGNAFLAQQSDVMDAVQRMRMKAQGAGNLKTSEQQKVETQVVENKSVIVIEQANPQVVYVPSYNPTVVYGPPIYPYPPIAYPPVGAYVAGAAIGFGVGIAMGAAWGGGWGYHAGWGGNNTININNNNSFVNNSNRTNVNGGNRTNVNGGNRANVNGGAGGNSWQHNPQHRGGTPYSDRSTAGKYGGTTREASAANRQGGAAGRNQGLGQQPGAGNRAAGSAGQAGAANRGASARQQPAGGNRGGANNIGNRSVPSGGSSRSAFGGGGGGYSGSSARANSSRGSSSMSGSRGGGGGGGRRR